MVRRVDDKCHGDCIIHKRVSALKSRTSKRVNGDQLDPVIFTKHMTAKKGKG